MRRIRNIDGAASPQPDRYTFAARSTGGSPEFKYHEDLPVKMSFNGFGPKRIALHAVFLLAAAFIVFMLFWGGRQPVAVGLFPAPYDKLAHFVAYAALSLALWVGVNGKWPFLVFMLVVAIGGLDELHQIYLPGRQAGWDDFFVDALAAGVAVSLLSKYNSAFRRLAKRLTQTG